MAEQNDDVVNRSIKLLGESLLTPGFSLLLDGQIKQGTLHTGLGLLARVALGIPGAFLVAANSYSVSTTGKSLYVNLFNPKDVKDYNIKDAVKQDVAAGRSLDEINARVAEDIEDIYEETVASLRNGRQLDSEC
ncbi:DUF6072 family protein [Candidatus Entotheonella palauensis]|uniref:Uncharacterized protein n=1 Tax=Candidatus Entotheonella gemina TaxID=1429439 RepID=W4M9W8_9BACT|nr:DUF6072 family protein [Candidatus Entotheonella palauensis]ETX06970.1 MAG: hypothetical protein ETSY2_13975 [Candidatus Entotheonella gemina]